MSDHATAPAPAPSVPLTAVADAVRRLLAEQLAIEPDECTPDALVEGDLGADSLDGIEIVMAIEERFGVELPDETAEQFATVGDIVAWLTAQGATPKRLLHDTE